MTSIHIYLKDVRFHAFHGVDQQEQIVGTDFIVNLNVKAAVAEARESDDVCDTINYASLYAVVKEEVSRPSKLIGHVCGRIAKRLFSDLSVIEDVTLSITKVNPPIEGIDSSGAGVELHVSR